MQLLQLTEFLKHALAVFEPILLSLGHFSLCLHSAFLDTRLALPHKLALLHIELGLKLVHLLLYDLVDPLLLAFVALDLQLQFEDLVFFLFRHNFQLVDFL